jgi:hypothetical protein
MHHDTVQTESDRSTTSKEGGGDDHGDDHPKLRSYGRFGAMIAASMVVMFGIMYLNTYQASHVQWSETRFYMTFVMGAAMAVIMLSFMWGMYRNRKVNLGIYLGAAVVFAGALWLVRSQATVGDTSYMRAMIPHHSIAVLTSENAGIEDARVRELADEIVAAQCREIAEMKWLIDDIDRNGVVPIGDDAGDRATPGFSDRC